MRGALLGFAAAGALLASACTGQSRPSVPTLAPLPTLVAQPTSAPREDGLPSFDIWAHDDSYIAPDSVPAGRIGVTLHVDGHEQRNAQFFKVKDKVSLAQVAAAFQQNPRSATELLDFVGGPGTVPPGGIQDEVQDLTEGQYVMATLLLGQDGQQYVPTGMIKTFRVVGPAQTPAAAPPLPGDQRIVLSDFAFGIPQLQAGQQTLELQNVGSQPHEILVKRLEPGHDLKDALNFVIAPVGTPPYSDAGGFLVFPGGETTSLTLDLSPGPYVAICYFRDPASGKTHAELGMIRDFDVE
ncbi:MAG: hypothetical protein JOZ87_01760 [Chloroflexi bacterium]|nr:hypothetical protein [Chloroflexota bacterium]